MLRRGYFINPFNDKPQTNGLTYLQEYSCHKEILKISFAYREVYMKTLGFSS